MNAVNKPNTPVGRNDSTTFAQALRAEVIKTFSLRFTFWLFAAIALMMISAAVLKAADAAAPPYNWHGQEARGLDTVSVDNGAMLLGQLLVATFGVLAGAGEYSAGTVFASIAAVPRRGRLFAAKAVVVGTAVFIICTGVFALSWLTAALVFSLNQHPVAVTWDTLRVLTGAAGYLALVAVFGLGLGVLLRSTAAGVTTTAAVLFVLPFMAVLVHVDVIGDSPKYLPWFAGEGLYMTSSPFYFHETFAPWQALLIVAAWAAASCTAALAALASRDA